MSVAPPNLSTLMAEPGLAAPDSLISSAEVRRFLRFYGAALEGCDLGLSLFSLPGAVTFSSRDCDALAEQAVRWATQKLDVYLHIHLHGLREGEARQRGSIDTAGAAIGLFSDIDARGPGRKKPPETLCPTVEDAIWVVEQFNSLYSPLQVSLVIASGHGCYPAILLKEPLVVATPDDKKQLEFLGRRFHQALQSIAAKRGWTGAVDYCDLAKVLRLPGCVNYKDASNPRPVRLIYENAARFTLSDLDDLLPPPASNRLGAANKPDASGVPEVVVALNANVQVDPSLIAALGEAHPLFTTTWNHQRPDLDDQSCSGYDLALANIGVACGLTDQQIANLLVFHRAKLSKPKQERSGASYLGYLRRTISRARCGKQPSEAAEREWAAVEAVMDSPATSVRAANVACEEHAQATPLPSDLPASPQDNVDEASADDAQGAKSGGVTAGMTVAEPPVHVHAPAEFLLAKVRVSGDVKFVYENITLIAELSDADVAALYQDLKTALGSKLNYNHFNKAVKDARSRQRWRKTEKKTIDPRPVIRTDDRLLDEIAADAIGALEAANQPPVVFRRGGALVLIHPDEDSRPVIMRATEPMMRGRLARVARFLKECKDGLRRVSPPEDLTRDILASNEGQFPPLGVLTQVPILRPDGTFRLDPGYDPATRAYYAPTQGFELPPSPLCPTSADMDTTVRLLDEAIGEFPFESAADKANCLALLLTPILRIAFGFKAPLALIDAPKWGTGKTLLAMVVYVTMTGSEGTVCAAPTTEEEWRKRMTSLLERGSAVTIIDNVDQPLRSPSLSAVLTTSYWEDRVLGRTEDIRLPNVSTWIATGNNLVLGGEMARRAYRIRLDAKVANPAGRTGFKRTDQDLLSWVAAHRGELVGALLTMTRAWFAAGQPKADVPAFGSFNPWARTVGGILRHAGVSGFLGNLESVQKEADEESAQWDQFLRHLAITFGASDFTISEIVDRILHQRTPLSLSFPDDIGHPDERIEGVGMSSLARRVGKAFARKCGTRFGDLQLRIERGRPDTHTKVQRWHVAGELDALMGSHAQEHAGFEEED